jgi:hypothetical protein
MKEQKGEKALLDIIVGSLAVGSVLLVLNVLSKDRLRRCILLLKKEQVQD